MTAPKHWDELKTFHALQHYQESDLRLSINSPAGIDTLWVLVEGDADPYFYERMFDTSRTKVVKVGRKGGDEKLHGGNRVVRNFVANLLALGQTQRIIGIIDRDWRPFKKDATMSLPPNIFETDLRDLEMTFLSYPSLREALKLEVTSTMNPKHKRWFKNGYCCRENGDWFQDVWERCCEVSRYMGSLRIVAAHYDLPRVDFTVSDCWDEEKHALRDGWENRLFSSAMKQTECCYFRWFYYCRRVKHKYDLDHRIVYDICRGHDFLPILSEMLIDKAHYSERWMTFFMTKEMTAADIRGMWLYQDIDRWAATVGVALSVH